MTTLSYAAWLAGQTSSPFSLQFGAQTLELTSANNLANIDFYHGIHAKLQLDSPATYQGILSNFNYSDMLDLVGISATSASFNSSTSTLTVNEANGRHLTFHISGDSLDLFSPTVSSDGNGGTLIQFLPTGTLDLLTATGTKYWASGSWSLGQGLGGYSALIDGQGSGGISPLVIIDRSETATSLTIVNTSLLIGNALQGGGGVCNLTVFGSGLADYASSIYLQGGGLIANSFSGQSFAGRGTEVKGFGVIDGAISNLAFDTFYSGSSLTVQGAIGTGNTFTLEGSSGNGSTTGDTLRLSSSISFNSTIKFAAPAYGKYAACYGATLQLATPDKFTGSIMGFAVGDTIELEGVGLVSATYNIDTNLLSIHEASGQTLAFIVDGALLANDTVRVASNQNAQTSAYAVVTSNGSGGSLISFIGALLVNTTTQEFLNYIQAHTQVLDSIFDNAQNISSSLDELQANISQIKSIIIRGGLYTPSPPLQVTAAQLISDAQVLSLITGTTNTGSQVPNVLIVTDARISGLDLVLANAQVQSVAIADTAANITANLANLEMRVVGHKVTAITISDHQEISLSSADQATYADVLSLISSGGGSFSVLASSFSKSVSSIQSIGLSPDGHYLLIKIDGATQSVAAGSSLSFNGNTVTTDDLTHMITPLPVFKSSGGTGGYALPDVFTGPASLGLKYQLIESADNAVVTGSSGNEFIKVASANSIGKAVDGAGGSDVIDGGVGSTFVTGGAGHNDTFFLDGRAPGVSWSTITDFRTGVDKATIWGFVKGVSSIDATFGNFNNEGATGYQGLTLHFKNLLPDGQTAGSNPNLNSITLSGHTLAEFGAVSLADLNNQINNGTNAHFIVGATNDSLGTHGYLQVV